VEREFAGSGYGAFKGAVADAVVEALRPLQESYTKLEADPAEVDRQLALGADKARAIADPVLARARNAAGLLPPHG
jgi:tryptophanyl-tRNA synthetase